MFQNWEDRTHIVLSGKEEVLHKSHIAVLGAGGVGGNVIEMLARMGVGELTIIDFDVFDETNLNRQILCTRENIGKVKVEEAKKRIQIINPDCKVNIHNTKITEDNIDSLISENYDYVIDAIDDIKAKIANIYCCNKKKIPLICAMGAGNRFDSPVFEVCDLWKTSYDGLARKLRNELKKDKFFEKVNVCYTKKQLEKTNGKLGSIVYYPMACASTLVSFVVNELIN